MSKWWKEHYIGRYAFYCGLLSKNDVRLGVTLGNRESCIDILWFTVGFMKM